MCSNAYPDVDPTSTKALFYLFSNVNNGKPKISCQTPIRVNVLAEAQFYLIVLYSMAFGSFLAIVTFLLVLLSKCLAWCKKFGKADAKPRAANRMVISDFDGIKQ